jgi:hypothetical protein
MRTEHKLEQLGDRPCNDTLQEMRSTLDEIALKEIKYQAVNETLCKSSHFRPEVKPMAGEKRLRDDLRETGLQSILGTNIAGREGREVDRSCIDGRVNRLPIGGK